MSDKNVGGSMRTVAFLIIWLVATMLTVWLGSKSINAPKDGGDGYMNK
jgi:hypothetical protein